MMAKKGFLDGYKKYDTSEGFGNARQWKHTFSRKMKRKQAEEVLNSQSETPHSILGITTDASQSEIKKAFRRLIFEWHPDRNQHQQERANAMSQKIIAAYSFLIQEDSE